MPQIYSSIPLQKRAVVLPGISTTHSIASYNKTRHIPSYQGWARQLTRMTRVSKADKKSQKYPPQLPLLRIPQEYKLQSYNIYAEDIAQALCYWFSLCDPCLVDSLGQYLVVFSTPLSPTILPPSLPELHPNVWLYFSVSVPIIGWMKPC